MKLREQHQGNEIYQLYLTFQENPQRWCMSLVPYVIRYGLCSNILSNFFQTIFFMEQHKGLKQLFHQAMHVWHHGESFLSM